MCKVSNVYCEVKIKRNLKEGNEVKGKIWKRILAAVLAISMMFGDSVVGFAADNQSNAVVSETESVTQKIVEENVDNPIEIFSLEDTGIQGNSDIEANGTCGEGLIWSLDTGGTLTISGTGSMEDYISSSYPWRSYRSSITNVNILDGVTSIGNSAFYGCSKLEGITLPESLLSIGEAAFRDCENLESIIIPENVITVGNTAFYDCSSLKEMVIPESVTDIGSSLVCGCTSLMDVIILGNITSIGQSMFWNCKSLESVTIPASVTGIGVSAFNGCDNLKNVYFAGTEREWNKLVLRGAYEENNECLLEVLVEFGSIDEIRFDGGNGMEQNPYLVSNASQLNVVRKDLKAHYVQTADIDLEDVIWEPIGSLNGQGDAEAFSGTYDGNGYKISNMTISSFYVDNVSIGFVSYNEGTLKNINLEGTDIDIAINESTMEDNARYYPRIGGIAGDNDGTIINCSNSGGISVNLIYDKWVYVGGIVGFGPCDNCVNYADIVASGDDGDYGSSFHLNCGGIVGYSGAVNRKIRNCVNYGNLNCRINLYTAQNQLNCGGISGYHSAIFNCVNYGNITGSIYSDATISEYCCVGGVTGYTNAGSGNYEDMSGCVNFGDVYAYSYSDGKTSCCAGGIFGYFTGEANNCYNLGAIVQADYSNGVDARKNGRITGRGGAANDALEECYSIDTTIIGTPVYDGAVQGASMNEEQMNAAIEDILDLAGLLEFEQGENTPESGENITQKIISGEFSYLDYTGEVSTYTYTYNESWFQNSSYDYQHGLTKMSLRMAMAAGDVREAGRTDGAENIKELMGDLGFDYSEEHSHYPSPEYDSIGYAIGNKEIVSGDGEKSTLIAVAVRGSGYGLEWGGNFRVGTTIDHEGFRLAADQVIDGLEKYIADNNEKFQPRVKVWITGFSRAAATANLVAAYLDDGFIEQIKCEDVFAFCFECPQNTTNNQSNNVMYNNIVNIINPLDLVPKVAMTAWGFTRFGSNYFLPSREVTENYNELKRQMRDAYFEILMYQRRLLEGDVLENILEHNGQASALDDLADNLATMLSNREYYQKYYEEDIVNGLGEFLGKGIRVDNLGEIITAVPALAGNIFPVLMNYKFAEGNDFSAIKMNAHYMELCMAWLDSLDGLYEEDYLECRRLFINCPVDVMVYRGSELVGQISNDIPQNIEEGVVTYIDGNGQKVIVLPNDCEYEVQFAAIDNGDMTYTVTEYNMNSRETEKIVSYYEVPITEGQKLESTIENLEEIPDAEYILRYEDGEKVEPTIEQTDDQVENYEVNVESAEGGTVTGGGYFVSGEFAKVIAVPEENYLFAGWYLEGDLISEEQEYRFLVNKDIVLTAYFKEKEQCEESKKVIRLYGSTRYETSYAIASALKEQLGLERFDTVILANGNNFPDALAGSYLARVKDAPILMAREKNKDSLQTFIKNNLKSGGTIYVLGGTGAVPDSVLSGLSGYNVERLSGETRYETNLLILEEAGVTDEDILVCTGNDFADSLSASATGKPILLLNNKKLTEEQKAFLEEHTGNRYYIIGGTEAVNQSMENEIQKYGTTERVYGTSRYETSIKVAEKFFMNPEIVVLAYAKNFPDGLCGGPLAMNMDAPLILTSAGKVEAATNYVEENSIQQGYVLGGEGVLPDDAVRTIFDLSVDDEITEL